MPLEFQRFPARRERGLSPVRSLVGGVVLLLFSVGCGTPPERILFSSARAGNSDIYLMDPTGSDIEPLTRSDAEEWAPVWYDDRQISFLRQAGESIVIVRLNIETGEETVLPHPTECVIDDKNILYSPARKTQLFVCNGDVFFQEVERVVNLTEDLSGQANYADWVDEQRVTFTNNADGNNNLYTVDLVTGKRTQLTDEPANDERGAISPDGHYLVYSSDRFEPGNQDIVLLDLASRDVVNISNSPGVELIARWSPTSDRIYFGSNQDGNWEIYVYELASRQTTRLTNDPGFDGDPRIR